MEKIYLKFKYYLPRYSHWFFIKPKFVWATLLITMIPFIILTFLHNKEWLVRIGWLLQIISIGIILYDIKKTSKQFDKYSYLESFKIWFSERPENFGTTKYIEPESIICSIKPLDITLTTVPQWYNNKGLQENLKLLIKEVEKNREKIEETEDKLREEIALTHNSMYEKNRALENLVNDLEKKLVNVATDGININIVSSCWLLMGITLSTIPDDLIYMLNILKRFF